MKEWRQNNRNRQLENNKRWRYRNKEHEYEVTNKRKTEKKLKAIEFLGGACSKCKQKFHHVCFDFHHVNPEEKDKPLSWLFHNSWENIEKELRKCVLLCSNCHRLEHYEHTKQESKRSPITDLGS